MSIPVYNFNTSYESELYAYQGYAYIYDGVFGYNEPGVEYGGDVSQSAPTSTLNQELNRLANGGTYRLNPQMVDMALAARQWAAVRGVTTKHTDTVGVLNDIAGRSGSANLHLDFSGVCNLLAGTSGLPAAAALREIES